MSRLSIIGGDPVEEMAHTYKQCFDLTCLRVNMSELRWIHEEKTWHYVLEISMGPTKRWQILKRYSEIRDFWGQLCTFLNGHHVCTERNHFLAGFENDKFPKKKIFHSKNVLEARANELEDFFQRLCMRLNLCSQKKIQKCQLLGCQLLELITTFFQVTSSTSMMTTRNTCSISTSRPQHLPTLKSYKSLILRRNIPTCGEKKSSMGRFSLSSLEDARVLLH